MCEAAFDPEVGLWAVKIGPYKFFPAQWEAEYYARIRNEGFSDIDAMRLIHVERVWAVLNLEGVE